MTDTIVTTVKGRAYLDGLGKALAVQLGCPFVARGEHSLQDLQRQFGQLVTVIVGEKRISARVGEEEFFFHPSMALLRLMNYLKGDPDRMAQAMAIEPGMCILDCTLGFATDALVASFLVGSQGSVTGLEASPVVAMLVRYGLVKFNVKIHAGLEPNKARALAGLPAAMGRITILNQHHQDFLSSAPTKSFDVVYFDPMFRHPRNESASMSPLRNLAIPDPLSALSIEQACRVARKRVVLKESRQSSEFSRLGFRVLPGGKYSEVAYGIIEV